MQFVYVCVTFSLPPGIKELIKRISKVHEKNMSRERTLTFENYKPIRVWLWFVYKITENNSRSQFFVNFIQI